MQLDKKALEAAAKVVAGYFGERHTETFYRGAAADIITAYLAALEPQDGVEVRAVVGVAKEDGRDVYDIRGWEGADDLAMKHNIDLADADTDTQFRIIAATVSPWQPPDEPVTRGREVG